MHRVYRAGDSVEDYCRQCKLDRLHTVVAADPSGLPIRVVCGYCRSEHNFRGGPRMASGSAGAAQGGGRSAPERAAAARQPRGGGEPFPLVSERERIAPQMAAQDVDLELLLRRIIREETGLTAAIPADRFRGGTLVLRPGNASQEKSWPIETFFHKIVMIRNRLRTLEQQVNATELPEDVKVKLQSYITGCYGSLTSFNVLFSDEEDQFRGSSE